MLTYILILLCLPPLCAVLALAAGFGNNILHWLHRLTATAVGVCVALMAKSFNPAVPYVDDYFYIDALNMWVIIIITTLYLAATWTARNYLTREERCGVLKGEQLQTGRYFALMQLFCWTMFIVLLVKNLGLMWVAIEATTLISALLISFKFTRAALEATWKYIMVCTVGICLALLGTLVLYYAQLDALGGEKALSWLYLHEHAKSLNPAMTKLALLFIVIGYGTKAGMAPMHTWLPDAYAEAPSLTSGMLSGALCSCAIYVLLRNLVILLPTAGAAMMSSMLLFFAVLTVAIAVPVVQGIAALMNNGAGMAPEVFYFGLLTGATLGGNLTPIGASANIAAIGILRKNGETVRTADFLRIGVPFTLAAVLTGSVYLWLVWGGAL